MPSISRRTLALAVATRLVDVTNATGYLGQIGARNGLPGLENTPADPPTKGGTDQRVKPYFVLFPGVGSPSTEVDLGDSFIDLDVPFQITAAAGDTEDLLALVDRIHDCLYRWAPGVLTDEGVTPVVIGGPLRTPPGYVPPVLTDTNVTPHRLYTPLQYVLTAHI